MGSCRYGEVEFEHNVEFTESVYEDLPCLVGLGERGEKGRVDLGTADRWRHSNCLDDPGRDEAHLLCKLLVLILDVCLDLSDCKNKALLVVVGDVL